MGVVRIVSFLLGVLAISEAFVEFDKSRLYGETDFEALDGMVYVSLYCSQGCHIYASIPTDSEEVAKKIIIQADGAGTSLFDANINAEDGLKTPFVVKVGNAQVNFNNRNDRHESAPMAVWIVRGDAPLFGDVDVYDGALTDRQTTPAKGTITILGVQPYQLEVTSVGAGAGAPVNSFNAISAGYDALDSPDVCTRIIREDFAADYQDLHYAAVRSPLLTLAFYVPDTTTVMVSTGDIDRDTIGLGYNMFVTSPGYIGCSVKQGTGQTKTFRSSLYEKETKAHFIGAGLVSVVISSDLNTDADHTVDIVADGQPAIKWTGTGNDQSMNLDAQDLTISWTRNDDDLDQYFLIRVEPDNSPKTTTAEPEPEPIKTTTLEPEPEPVKTTTEEPEPEPVKTTTPEPEPEPIRTTTQKPEPEPIKTTTAEQEPEPVETTTAEPEPVETTTGEPDPVKTTSPVSTTKTRRTMQTTTYHPKSTVTHSSTMTVSSTTVKPTTSGAGYGSLCLSLVLAAAIVL